MKKANDLINDPQLKTFKQLDELYCRPKGSAFRVFKRLEAQWLEGEHFYCIDSRNQPELFADLRRSGRLYPSTVNAVLIAETGCQLIAKNLVETL